METNRGAPKRPSILKSGTTKPPKAADRPAAVKPEKKPVQKSSRAVAVNTKSADKKKRNVAPFGDPHPGPKKKLSLRLGNGLLDK